MEQPMPQPLTPTMPPVMPQQENPSFFGKYKFFLISLFVILLAAVPLLYLSRTTAKPTPTPVAQMPSTVASPTVEPLTTGNADAVLSQTDTTLQNALNQTDVDLKAAAAVDTTQDSTTGL